MIRFEWRNGLDVFDELEPWWNLQAGPRSLPFLRTEWFRLWAECRIGPGEKLRVLVGRDGESPVAAVPLLKRGPRLVGLADTDSDSFDIICTDDPEVQEAVAAKLARCTYIRLDRLDGESPLMRNVPAVPGWRVRRVLDPPYIVTAGGMEPVLSEMGKKLRNNVRRARRHLESAGRLSIDLVTPGELLPSVLEESLALEARSWKGSIGRAVADSQASLLFYRRLTDLALARDWLRLGVMRLDGRIVAFNLDLEYQNRLFGILTAYDEELDSKFSPGHVLLFSTLERCSERGIETYELGGGNDNSWKLRWTSNTRRRYDIVGFGTNAGGLLSRAASRMLARMSGLYSRGNR